MARLTKEQLADRSRYKFNSEEVEIPELGGSVEIKTLTVKERDALPELVRVVEDGEGNKSIVADASLADTAKAFATVVSDPKLTQEEAEAFLGDLPASALDRVIEKFGELLSVKEEDSAATRREFRPQDD